MRAVVRPLIGVTAMLIAVMSATQGSAAMERTAQIVWRGVEAYPTAKITNAMASAAENQATCNGVPRPAVFLHPQDEGRATADFKPVTVTLQPGTRLFFVGYAGIVDGAQWNDPKNPADGAGFHVTINGTELAMAELKESKWLPLAAAIPAAAGGPVTLNIQLATDCGPDHNSNYDWARFGEPMVVAVSDHPIPASEAVSGTAGLVIAQLAAGHGTLAVEGLDAAGAPVKGAEYRATVDGPGLDMARFDFSDSPAVVAWRYRIEGMTAQAAWGGSWQPSVEVTGIDPAQAVYVAGEPVHVRVGVRNTGLAGVVPEHAVVFEVAGKTQKLDRLGPGETGAVEFDLGPQKAGPVRTTYSWRIDGHHSQAQGLITTVWPALPNLTGARPTAAQARELGDGYVLLENPAVRWLVQTRVPGMGALVWVWDGGAWKPVGSVSPLVQMVGPKGTGAPIDMTATVRMEGEAATLAGEGTWGGAAAVSVGLRLPARGDILGVDVRAKATKALVLGALRGPAVNVGDRCTGTEKGLAVFPGLEYLRDGERSSSKRDLAPPLNEREVPHNLKITVPMMMVQTAPHGPTVALIWDPRQKWDGEHAEPAACFASPNFLQHENNHLMQLMAPSVPDFIPENTRFDPDGLKVAAGKELHLRQYVAAGVPSPDFTGGFDWFKQVVGFPGAETWPRSFDDEIALCRRGFMKTVWDAQDKKSRHYAGATSSANAPGFATLLLMDGLAVAKGEARQQVIARADLIGEQTYREQGAPGLTSRANTHIMAWEFPYHWGYLPGALAGMRSEAYGALSSQEADGGWAYHPDERRSVLGAYGTEVSGTCAEPAYVLAKYAAISGDPTVLAGLKKALAKLRTFQVPRGAQGWECPIHEPDVLAAAYCVRAYVWGYMATGDRSYLADARRWARSGLAFQYAWDDGHHPGMRYASIPVFGSTFFTHSWLGLPVQWCGLVYAYSLQELERFDKSDPWSKVWRKEVEGITVSAMYQQWPMNSEYAGTYPDSFARYFAGRNRVYINPEDIEVNLLAMHGLDPGLRVARAELGGGSVGVTAPADVTASVEGDTLRADVKYLPGQVVYLTVAPVAMAQGAAFTSGGEALAHKAGLAPGTVGYDYDADLHVLCLGVKGDGQGKAEVSLKGLSFSPVKPPKPRNSWDFNSGVQDWGGVNSCQIKDVDGALRITVTGNDPYVLSGPCNLEAAQHKQIELRVRATGGQSIALHWRTNQSQAWGEDKHVELPLTADGQWHDVTFDLGAQKLWSGRVLQIRLDVEPADTPPGTTMDVDWIRPE